MQFNCNQGKWSSTGKEIEQSPRPFCSAITSGAWSQRMEDKSGV